MSANQKNTVDKAKKTAAPDLDPRKQYVITGTGTNRHLKEGVDYPVSGADAAALIESGHATLKDDKQ